MKLVLLPQNVLLIYLVVNFLKINVEYKFVKILIIK